jgi:tryptophanyl-tRNA synthetase
LLSYPVLMAGDILLYNAERVPVGDDQKQHLEITRDIAQRFNHMFGATFVLPEVMIPPSGARLMGLDDPTAKMSKSNAAQGHAVAILDAPDAIRKKIMRATTDSGREITFNNDPLRAGVNNLLTIYQAFTGLDKDAVEAHFTNARGYGDLKKEVAEAVVEGLKPIQERYHQIMADKGYIDGILAEGAEKARAVADQTLRKAKEAMGFLAEQPERIQS